MSNPGYPDPTGHAQVRDLGDLTVTKLSVGPIDNNCYLLTWIRTGETVIIDAAAEADRIMHTINADPTVREVRAIITTHCHADHHQALAEVVVALPEVPELMAGANDADALPVPVHRRLQHGDVISIGDGHLEVIALRGHTPGSIALAYREPTGRAHLFTGDSLFPGGPGRTESTEDFTTLMDDLEQRVFDAFGDDAWVYPGHGDDTTLGAERGQLPAWRARGW